MTKKKEKYIKINELLEEEHLLIHFDASFNGVEVPPHLQDNPSVTLKLSYAFQGGMEVTEEKIWASLLFGQHYCECVIPLDAIWGATTPTGGNTIWPENAPQDILVEMMHDLNKPQPLKEIKKPSKIKKVKKKKTPLKKKPNHLKRIK